MIKLIKDLHPFKKGEIITFGAEKDQKLIDLEIAIMTKISSTHYNTK